MEVDEQTVCFVVGLWLAPSKGHHLKEWIGVLFCPLMGTALIVEWSWLWHTTLAPGIGSGNLLWPPSSHTGQGASLWHLALASGTQCWCLARASDVRRRPLALSSGHWRPALATSAAIPPSTTRLYGMALLMPTPSGPCLQLDISSPTARWWLSATLAGTSHIHSDIRTHTVVTFYNNNMILHKLGDII